MNCKIGEAKSNYKPLGNYIELVSCLNNKLQYGENDVRGVSNNKEIIQTRANNEGRDFNTFYVVKPDEFIYNSRTSRMGDKVGLGYNYTKKTFITSFNNTVFRVKDEALLPKYLYMWFNRPEFDRYVRFNSWGSSTEIFSWEEMCNTLLPVPSIDKQREIVKEYNVIQNRITLNQQLIQKLEETTQAIYKQWFVEGIDLENLPEGWNIGQLDEIKLSTLGGDWGKDTPIDNFNKEVYCIRGTDIPTANLGQKGNLPTRFILSKNLINRKLEPFDIVTEISGGSPTQSTGRSVLLTAEYLDYLRKDIICSNFCRVIKAKENCSIYLFATIGYLYNSNILFTYENSSNGVKNLAIEDLFKEQIIAIPDPDTLNNFNTTFLKIYRHLNNIGRENEKLVELKELLLSKLATVEN